MREAAKERETELLLPLTSDQMPPKIKFHSRSFTAFRAFA